MMPSVSIHCVSSFGVYDKGWCGHVIFLVESGYEAVNHPSDDITVVWSAFRPLILSW